MSAATDGAVPAQVNGAELPAFPKSPGFDERIDDHHDHGEPRYRWRFVNQRGDHVDSVRIHEPSGKKVYREPKGMKGPWLPLYHRHLDFDSPIVVCEGEKTTDAVWEAGYQATCWLGGSGARGVIGRCAKWLVKNGAKRFVLWPDDDDVGEKAMTMFADACRGACVVVRESVDGVKGADAADFPIERCAELIQQALARLNGEGPETATIAVAGDGEFAAHSTMADWFLEAHGQSARFDLSRGKWAWWDHDDRRWFLGEVGEHLAHNAVERVCVDELSGEQRERFARSSHCARTHT